MLISLRRRVAATDRASQELVSLPQGNQGPKYVNHHPLLPRVHVIRKLEGKQGRNSETGILKRDAGAP